MPAAALVDAVGVNIDQREIALLQGATAVARDLTPDTLDLPHVETPHPGGETNTITPTILNYFLRRLICFSVGFRQKDISMNCILRISLLEGCNSLPCFLRSCCSCVLRVL